ncbi:MAG: cyclic nucleotide-binding domain-containing protein [Candidatus Electrothrix communis]|nr:cyclic nucleotide-binding domain-containing protein [Desulfobulbus sp. US4]WLE96796.1 MAG: cyclic nucleotide-binding domain-containing protein [Candidatus Electrothrix communis]
MNNYRIITTDDSLFETVSASINSLKRPDRELGVERLTSFDEAVDYISTELPEIIFIDFSESSIDGFALLDVIMQDQWLLHTGIIAFSKTPKDTERIEAIQGANIIVAIEETQIKASLSKIISIIMNNRRILFQHGLGMNIVENISGAFELNNDQLEVKCYANLIANFLFNTKKIDRKGKFNLQLSLMEMLMNGVEHGNCAITFEEKSQWLESGRAIGELISLRHQKNAVAAKRVYFKYTLNSSSARFSVADQGQGFDWRTIMRLIQQQGLLALHGRGIFITQSVTKKLTYNDKGNMVTFEFAYNPEKIDLTPGLFNKMPIKNINKGETIFQQGESSSCLYYIVNGYYDIIVNDKKVSCLNPDDIFMGEMSFLLNNHRSATVRAKTAGQLIKITKKEFVQSIKRKPHYALFLTRLLARRIHRGNHFDRIE